MSVLYQETVKKYFRGFQYRKFHDSKVCGCKMSVGVFLPEAYSAEERQIPVIYYLSGLTCTDENASQKSCIQKYADEQGVAVVFPDTSPRGHNVDGEKDSWDFGVGAGKQFRSTHTHRETERERERDGETGSVRLGETAATFCRVGRSSVSGRAKETWRVSSSAIRFLR